MTGGRLKRMKKYIGNDTFFLTYGDGLCDVNINKLLEFHKNHGKLVTITAVHPGARFGELLIKNNEVCSFKEKPQTNKGWINGGFFVIEPEFLEFISDDQTILEKEPLERQLEWVSLWHITMKGFGNVWIPKKIKDMLEELWKNGKLDFI